LRLDLALTGNVDRQASRLIPSRRLCRLPVDYYGARTARQPYTSVSPPSRLVARRSSTTRRNPARPRTATVYNLSLSLRCARLAAQIQLLLAANVFTGSITRIADKHFTSMTIFFVTVASVMHNHGPFYTPSGVNLVLHSESKSCTILFFFQ